jgi:phosphoglycerol transferase MdoB-like AlkP superfamily enzyme
MDQVQGGPIALMRWIVLLPASLFAALLSYQAVAAATEPLAGMMQESIGAKVRVWIAIVPPSITMGAAFILVAATVAPSRKRRAAFFLTAAGLLASVGLALVHYSSGQTSQLVSTLAVATGLLLGSLAVAERKWFDR